jgi:hypothetical protein
LKLERKVKSTIGCASMKRCGESANEIEKSKIPFHQCLWQSIISNRSYYKSCVVPFFSQPASGEKGSTKASLQPLSRLRLLQLSNLLRDQHWSQYQP